MSAEESLRAGQIDEALRDLQDRIRRSPADAKLRTFLFQILTVLGDWDRALSQLQVIGDLDAGALPMVHTYREAIRCERLRAQVFEGKSTPLVFGSPERWAALMIEAVRLSAEGHHGEAQRLRDEAFELAPATAGTIDGQPFEWIADADPRLGPIVEAIVNGAYYWVPFARIREIRITEPTDLRDVVWTPIELMFANGGTMVGLMPCRYPGSEASTDSLIRLARKTDWVEAAPEQFHGLGQRMLATDSGEYALLDVRLVTLQSEAPASEGAEGEAAAAGEAPAPEAHG
jgi:type VI secretion system protein ImpE